MEITYCKCGNKKDYRAKKCLICYKNGKKNQGYHALHIWIKNRKPKPKFCERCKQKKPYDLANISNDYHKDINDWEWLCRKCHMEKDGRLKNLSKYNFKTIEIDINLIKHLYFKEKLSITKIAKITKVNYGTIYNRLKQFKKYTGRRCAFKEKQMRLL